MSNVSASPSSSVPRSRSSPAEDRPVVPEATELRTTWESTELSSRGAEKLPAKSQRCKEAGRRRGGLLQCQHSIRLLKVLCSCSLACKLPPRRLAGTRGAPSVNVAVMETPAHRLLWSIQAHLDGDPPACSVLVWRLFQYTQNRRCCPSTLSLPPAAPAG